MIQIIQHLDHAMTASVSNLRWSSISKAGVHIHINSTSSYIKTEIDINGFPLNSVFIRQNRLDEIKLSTAMIRRLSYAYKASCKTVFCERDIKLNPNHYFMGLQL